MTPGCELAPKSDQIQAENDAIGRVAFATCYVTRPDPHVPATLLKYPLEESFGMRFGAFGVEPLTV